MLYPRTDIDTGAAYIHYDRPAWEDQDNTSNATSSASGSDSSSGSAAMTMPLTTANVQAFDDAGGDERSGNVGGFDPGAVDLELAVGFVKRASGFFHLLCRGLAFTAASFSAAACSTAAFTAASFSAAACSTAAFTAASFSSAAHAVSSGEQR